MSGAIRPTGVHFSDAYLRHDTGPYHPESVGRYRVLAAALEDLPEGIVKLPGRRAAVGLCALYP